MVVRQKSGLATSTILMTEKRNRSQDLEWSAEFSGAPAPRRPGAESGGAESAKSVGRNESMADSTAFVGIFKRDPGSIRAS